MWLPSNVDIYAFVSPRKTELPCKTELQPIQSPNGLLYSRVEVEQRTYSGDEIDNLPVRGSSHFYILRFPWIFSLAS